MAESQSTVVSSSGPAVDYRDVPGFPGYRVGSDGSVWSCWRQRGLGPGRGSAAVMDQTRWHRLVAPVGKKTDRPFVTLCRDGVKHHRRVCRLVLEAFVGPCPDGMEACHDPDPNPANNTLSNLRWDTPAGNAADCTRHGRRPRGSSHGNAKLTEADVRVIKRRLAAGDRQQDIADDLGVSKSAIGWIARGQTWAHVV